MTPPLLDELDELIARTRRRLALRKLIKGGSIGLHIGLWASAFGVLVVSQLVYPKHLVWAGLLATLVLVGGTMVLTTSWALIGRRLKRREVALLLDRSLDQDELFVTAAWLGEHPEHPKRDEILAQLARAPKASTKLSDALVIRFPRHLRLAPLALLVLLFAFFTPRLYNPFGPSTPAETEGERLADRLHELNNEFEGAELPEGLVGDVAKLTEDLTGDALSQEEAVERINELQDQLKDFKEQLEPSESVLDLLEEAADELGAELPDFEQALRDADLDGAADALEDLAEKTQDMTPEQKQATGEAMRKAGEALKSSNDPAAQQAGEALKSAGQQLSEQGQQAQQGQQGLSPEQVQGLQQQLQNAQQMGQRLQQDQRALERAQRINGALESSKQRLGGEASQPQGESSQQQGEPGQGADQQDGEGSADGQGGDGKGASDQGGQKGTGTGAGVGHTWEDAGEHDGSDTFQDANRNEATRGSTADKHIDDFQRLYDPKRLQNIDALIASEKGLIDERGHQDVLPMRRTTSDETSGQALIDAPEAYTRAAQDAIANETVPPGYRNAVKQYFDQME